jgi:hypothetical protein
MSRPLALFAIGLIFGGGAGFVIAAGNGVTFEGHDHSDLSQHASMEMQAEMTSHDHATAVNLPAGDDAPGLEIKLTKDPMAGWNLHVIPQNFRFAPQSASMADVDGEGHAHVYINGVKLGRLYGNWMHLSDLPKGDVDVTVSLNGNSHSPLMVDGVAVSADVSLQVE